MPLLKMAKQAFSKSSLLQKILKLFLKKMAELQNQYPKDYLAIYDLPLDTDLSKLPHHPGVVIEKEEFDNVDEATEVILTYEDDIVIPKIADTEGIKIISQSEHQIVLEYTCDEKCVKDYLATYGLPRTPKRISFEFEVEIDEDDDIFGVTDEEL